MAVRPHVPALSLSSPHNHSGVRLNFLRHRELLSHRQGTELVRGKSVISDRDNCHDGNNDIQVLPAPLACYRRDGRIPE